jgi:hypothetical protein
MSAAPHRPKLVDLSRIVCLGAALSLTGACDLDEVDIKTQDGKAPQVEDSLGKKVVTTPDGAQYTVKPGGTIVDADGNKTKIKRDGTIVQPDGTRVNIYGDGTKATMKVETIELGADGEKGARARRRHPNDPQGRRHQPADLQGRHQDHIADRRRPRPDAGRQRQARSRRPRRPLIDSAPARARVSAPVFAGT